MKSLHAAAFLLALGLPLAAACGGDSSVNGGDDDDGSGGSGASVGTGAGMGTGGSVTMGLVGAPGVTITEVAIYQGVKRTLAAGGVIQPPGVPLIAGRPALVRVFYTSDAPGTPVVGRLTLNGQPEIVAEAVTAPASVEGDLGSTINFNLTGAEIGATLDYAVSVLADAPADNPAAHYPAPGAFETHVVEGPQNVFRVVLVPFQYNADGSGRLPDTSPEAVEGYRQKLMQLYPVSNVEMTVRQPVSWNGFIGPFGQGWQEVMQETYALRLQDGVSPDTYYYSIFLPDPTFPQFCNQGCLLGVTGLNNQPPDIGAPELRWAVGLGYPEVGLNTCAHELGHSHGRAHVNCGPGVNPDSIDFQYPHNPNTIGTWGWDMFSGQLRDPAIYTDVMGYCDNEWISDYNYTALHNRGTLINQPDWQGEPPTYDVLMWDGKNTLWGSPITLERPFMGDAKHTVTLREGKQALAEAPAHFVPYDHLPGGMYFIPQVAAGATQAELVIDGQTRVFTR